MRLPELLLAGISRSSKKWANRFLLPAIAAVVSRRHFHSSVLANILEPSQAVIIIRLLDRASQRDAVVTAARSIIFG